MSKDVYWSYAKIHKCISNSFMSYLYNGHWETADRMTSLGHAEARKLSGSYNLFSVITEFVKPHPYAARISKKGVPESRVYKRLNKSLMPGKIRTMPGEVHSLLPEFKAPDMSDLHYVPKPSEAPSRVDIQFVDDEESSSDSDEIEIEFYDDDGDDTLFVSTEDLGVQCRTEVPDTAHKVIETVPNPLLNVNRCTCKDAIMPDGLDGPKQSVIAYIRRLNNAADTCPTVVKCGDKAISCPTLRDELSAAKARSIELITQANKSRSTSIPVKDYTEETEYCTAFAKMVLGSSDSCDSRSRVRVDIGDTVLRFFRNAKSIKFDQHRAKTPQFCQVWDELTHHVIWKTSYHSLWRKVLGTIINNKEVFAMYVKSSDIIVNDYERERALMKCSYDAWGYIPFTVDIQYLGEATTSDDIVMARIQAFIALGKQLSIVFTYGDVVLDANTDITRLNRNQFWMPAIGPFNILFNRVKERRLLSDELINILCDWAAQSRAG